MGVLTFCLAPLNKISKKVNLISKGATGKIILVDNEWLVVCDKEIYPITSNSFDTKGKRIVYSKHKENGRRFKIVRNELNERVCCDYGYIPFRENLICKGNIVEKGDKKYFRVLSAYNANSTVEKEDAINESNKLLDNGNSKSE